jgi:hypothetical protein
LRSHAADLLAVTTVAAIITIALALPVLRAPSERIFGMEIAGRHHDPFTVMAQFARPVRLAAPAQPVTDVPGAMLERAAGPVAAYNWIVLLSFPLSAAAAFMLARYLGLARAGATVAALAYAFSPFHIAQAAYHPHIAQTQWMPIYLLALWRCLDRATPAAALLLVFAAVAVTLSNVYAGMIAAVVTPVAVAAYWLVTRRTVPMAARRLAVTVGALATVAAGAIVYGWFGAAAALVTQSPALAFPRADLFAYSAKWWSYLLPPLAHPVLGAAAQQVWTGAGVREGLLEQQVSLGWGVIALALIALVWWVRRIKGPAPAAFVPVAAAVAVVALVCSLSPERTVSGMTFVRPSAVIYELAPMFRSYARFGFVVQLMAALLAGIGVEQLLRIRSARADVAVVILLAVAAVEYAVSPSKMWRDVLPTTAHRWMVQQPGAGRALDCTELTVESASVRWLSADRIALLGGAFADCTEPNLAGKLSAGGYSHLLVRRRGEHGWWLADRAAPPGFRVAARFHDGVVFAVTAPRPAVYTAGMTGFFPREHDSDRTWRWMGEYAAWTVVNGGAAPVVATLEVELASFHRPRRIELRLDGRRVQTLSVEPSRRMHEVGPLTVPPGEHHLAFHPETAPAPAGDAIATHDRRALSVALGAWSWTLVDRR